MVLHRSGEVWPGIEEACNSCVMLCEELDDCWRTEDIWVRLMTEPFNGGGTCITGDGKLLIFELLSFILKHRLSRGLLCEELDDCWQTEDSWYGLMTELFNGRKTYITGNDNLLLFEWLLLQLNHRLSRVVVRCLPWFFPVPLLWQLPIPLKRGMMNEIWVFGGVVCLLFFFDGHEKVISNILARQMQSCLSFTTRNKIDYDIFVSISS